MAEPDPALVAELRGPDPALARLAPVDAARLTADVRAARAAQQEAIVKAIDDAMSHVPRLLRGALRKILF